MPVSGCHRGEFAARRMLAPECMPSCRVRTVGLDVVEDVAVRAPGMSDAFVAPVELFGTRVVDLPARAGLSTGLCSQANLS